MIPDAILPERKNGHTVGKGVELKRKSGQVGI